MDASQPTMTVLQSIILGIVEGVTEYLPVSSTGLILTQRLLGIGRGDVADAFAICIQAGAILAVLGIYFRRVKGMTMGLLGRDSEGLQMALRIMAAFLPAMVIALLFKERVEGLMTLWNVVIAWMVGGIAILVAVKFRPQGKEGKSLEALTLAQAALIGFIQCLAMWPGTSRSLVTIVGGLLVGLNLAAAVEFSFLLGVLTLTAATVYKAKDHGAAMLQDYGPVVLAAGMLAAWISAFAAVKWMVAFLQRHGFAVFGYYRIILALVVGIFIWKGDLGWD
jgi:undecaprenyl-diphosphatase